MLPFVVSTFDDQVDDVVSKRPNCTNCLDHICTFDWRLAKVDHVYRFYVNRFWFIVLKCVISRFHFDDEYFLIRSDSLDILHLNLSMNILVEE